MKPTIHIFEGLDGFYLRVVSYNGETMLVSESYSRRWNAKRAAKRISSIFGGLTIREVSR